MEPARRPPCFLEPEVPSLAWGRYSGENDQVGWLERSTLPRAARIRAFLNRSLEALPAEAGAELCRRLHRDPPFGRVYFELIVGRFLQVMGAKVDHQPIGLAGANVDWRARFPDGRVVFVEATSPQYNQAAYRERVRLAALVGIVEEETPAGWWVHPDALPDLGPADARRGFRQTVRSLFANLPDRSGFSPDHPLRLVAATDRGPIVLELWPGDPTDTPIAFFGGAAYMDDSRLRVAVAARAKRHQARAFPGETVLLAIDAPFGGPDVEDFDQALFGSTVMHIGMDRGIAGYSFQANGALATQRAAEYAGVLAFGRVQMFGALDPILYHHPRFEGSLPAELLDLRQRALEGSAIRDEPATRTAIIDAIGFPSAED